MSVTEAASRGSVSEPVPVSAGILEHPCPSAQAIRRLARHWTCSKWNSADGESGVTLTPSLSSPCSAPTTVRQRHLVQEGSTFPLASGAANNDQGGKLFPGRLFKEQSTRFSPKGGDNDAYTHDDSRGALSGSGERLHSANAGNVGATQASYQGGMQGAPVEFRVVATSRNPAACQQFDAALSRVHTFTPAGATATLRTAGGVASNMKQTTPGVFTTTLGIGGTNFNVVADTSKSPKDTGRHRTEARLPLECRRAIGFPERRQGNCAEHIDGPAKVKIRGPAGRDRRAPAQVPRLLADQSPARSGHDPHPEACLSSSDRRPATPSLTTESRLCSHPFAVRPPSRWQPPSRRTRMRFVRCSRDRSPERNSGWSQGRWPYSKVAGTAARRL